MTPVLPTRLIRAGRGLAIAALFTGIVGCTAMLPAPQPSAAAVEQLRSAPTSPMNVGAFGLAPGFDKGDDESMVIRSNRVKAASGSFAQQLKDQIIADLKSAGLLDANSKYVLTGQLTQNTLDTGMITGTARLAAHFVVTRDGATVFDKVIAADNSWDSSFIGAVAIPRAGLEFQNMFPALANKLLADPDFHKAVAP